MTEVQSEHIQSFNQLSGAQVASQSQVLDESRQGIDIDQFKALSVADNQAESNRSSHADHKRVLQEVFLKPLHCGWNEVYKAPNAQERINVGGGAYRQPDWSQVFDLEQTILVCNVSKNKLVLQVVHWSDQPLKNYIAQHTNPQLGTSHFSLSEQRLRETEKNRFMQYQSASLTLDAQIVPDIQCELNHLETVNLTTEQIRSQKFAMQPYTLTIVTQNNMLYQVDFSPFMLIKGETIFIREPQPIKLSSRSTINLDQAYLSSFEVAKHPLTGNLVNIYGFQVSPKSGIDVGSTVVKEDHVASAAQSQLPSYDKGAIVKGGLSIFGLVADKIQKSFQAQTHQQQPSQLAQIMGESGNSSDHTGQFKQASLKGNQAQQVQPPRQQVFTRALVPQGNERGVVTIRALHQDNKVVVVFSNGEVKIFEVNEHGGMSLDLVDPRHLNECFSTNASIKVTNAKIGFATLSGQRKMLGVAYELTDTQLNVSVWNFAHIQLGDSLQFVSLQEIEQTNNQACSVTQLMMDTLESGQDFSAVVCLWDNSSLESTFLDLRGNCKVMDRQLNETMHKVYDQLTQGELSLIQLGQQNSSLQEDVQEVRNHLKSRITTIYRFSPQAIEEALKKAVSAWRSKTKRSMLSQLEEILARLPTHNILKLRDTISEIERKSSYVLCLQHSFCHNSSRHVNTSSELQEYPFRMMIRPLGISMLKEIKSSPCLTKLEHLIDIEVANAFKIARQMSLSTFKQNNIHEFNLNTSNLDSLSLLVRICSGIKLSLSSSLHRIAQSMIVDPTRLGEYFQFAFSQEVQLENLHQNLLQVISENHAIIQNELFNLVDKLLDYFNEFLPSRGVLFNVEAPRAQSSLINVFKVNQDVVSCDLAGMLEKSVLDHVNSLNQLILDLRMLQEFIDYYSLGQPDVEFYEQKQIRQTRLSVRHQQLLAVRQVFLTRVTSTAGQSSSEPPRDSTILFEMLSSDSKLLTRLGQATSKSSSSMLEAANDYVLGNFLSLHHNEYHPENLCTGMLRQLERKADSEQEIYLQAMSEYLKLMPDSFDLDMEVEHLVQVQYANRKPLDQQRITDELTSYQAESKMLLEYYRAYILAKLSTSGLPNSATGCTLDNGSSSVAISDELLTEFILHINNCMNYLFSKEFYIRSDSFNSQSFSLTNKHSSNIPNHKTIECVLVMADQFLQTKCENFSLLILQKAVVAINQGMPTNNDQQKQELTDLIYEKMFNLCNANTENGVKVMYKCCQSMSNKHEKRAMYVKVFFDKVVATGNITCLKTLVFNDEADIQEVIEKTKAKIEAQMQQRVPRQRNQQQAYSKALDFKLRVDEMYFQQGIKEEICHQINVLSIVAELYNMSDLVSTSLWKFKSSLDEDLAKIQQLTNEFEESATSIFGADDITGKEQTMLDHLDSSLKLLEEQHLTIIQNMLSVAQVCMRTLGPDFFIIARDTSKQSHKRSLNDRSHQMEIDDLPFDLSTKEEGMHGHISKVTGKLVDKELELAKCRLILLSEDISVGQDAESVVEYLSELGFDEEALELGKLYNLKSLALCFSTMISNQKDSEANPVFNQAKDLNTLVEKHLPELSAQVCLEVCKHLIVNGVEIPSALAAKIEDNCMVASVIESYLSIAADFSGVLSFLGDDTQMSKRITACAEQDIHTVLTLKDSVKFHAQSMDLLSKQLENKLKGHETTLREQHMMGVNQQDTLFSNIVRENLNEFEGIMSDHLKSNFQTDENLFSIVAQIEREADNFISPEDDPAYVAKRDHFLKIKDQAAKLSTLESKIVNILKTAQFQGNLKQNAAHSFNAPVVGSLFQFGGQQ